MAHAHVYGDDVNTDVIYPGRHLEIYDPKEMAKHAMEDIDKEFVARVRPGDIVIAGRNFGCGSSREQAAICLKHAGVVAIVADSFARIYFRNSINLGMPAVEADGANKAFATGDEVQLDMAAGVLRNLTKGTQVTFRPVPPFLMRILEDGGLVPHLKARLGGGQQPQPPQQQQQQPQPQQEQPAQQPQLPQQQQAQPAPPPQQTQQPPQSQLSPRSQQSPQSQQSHQSQLPPPQQ
jgi:3-isopropylmalate dehydratase small subunit